MCGIAGYIGSRELAPETVRACLDLMHHRGPDSAGVHRWAHDDGASVYFLHTRLQIIDLAPRSNQPFHAGATWLTYNGELYNYVELRGELQAAGETFSTESDTEVLARAFDRGGPEALDRAEGMWAFAAYNERDRSVTLARDRFGEKPLYLFRDATGLYFGSEVKFIAALAGVRLPIAYAQVYRYLVNGYRALYKGPQQFFAGIEAVPPGVAVRIAADGSETRRTYWRPSFETDESMTYEAAVEGTRERLLRAVKLRLRADVPLAFCMSGGVDSNSLISIAKRVFDYDVHGFTIMNEDARYNEEDMVAESVRALGVRHTGVSFSTDSFLDRLATLVAHHDAPVYTITYYVHWLLMGEIAARGYRIAISGTAADEMFTGYYDHPSPYLAAVAGTDQFEPSLAACQRLVAPIVRHPSDANVPEPTRARLIELSKRYRIVACVSGRPATVARQMVSIGSIAYIGNHGCELLRPGASQTVVDPEVARWTPRVRGLADRFGEGLALVERDVAADLLRALARHLADAAQERALVHRRDGAPFLERALRRGEGAVEVRRGRVGELAQHVAHRGIEHVLLAPPRALHELAVDVKA